MKNLVAAVAVMFAVSAYAGEGLKVGDRVGAYTVVDVTGPSQGETLCYRCQFGSAPVINVFARTMDAKVAQLISVVEEEVSEHDGLKGFVTYLGENNEANKAQLAKVASEKNIKAVPLTIATDGAKGPANYKLADADVTVLMWKNGQVVSAHTFSADALTPDAVKKVEDEIHSKLGS